MWVIRVAGPPFKLENVFLKRQDTAIGALASGGGVTTHHALGGSALVKLSLQSETVTRRLRH